MTPAPLTFLREKIADLVWRHTPHCHEMARLSSRECDAPLPWGTRLRMRVHMHFCVWCARYRSQIRLIEQLLAALDRHECEHGAGELSQETKERIRLALKKL